MGVLNVTMSVSGITWVCKESPQVCQCHYRCVRAAHL